jgi:hypothetical protein
LGRAAASPFPSAPRPVVTNPAPVIVGAPVASDPDDYFAQLSAKRAAPGAAGGSRTRTGTLTPSAPAPKPPAGAEGAAQFHTSAGGRARVSTLAPETGPQGTFKSALLIARPFSMQEILALAFDLGPSLQRAQLAEAIGKWRFEEIAASSFRRHRRGSRVQGKTIPIENLMSFTTVALKKPLLVAVPTHLKRVGAHLFELLLEYAGIRPGKNQISCMRQIIHALRENDPILIDEFYFQCIKQTINNRTLVTLMRVWEIFLIIATIFPCGETYYRWILAQVAAAMISSDERIALVATFICLRFQTRHYLGQILDYSADKHYPERIPGEITRNPATFGVLLYEIMWNQKPAYPRLPIPFVLYRLIELMRERNAVRTSGIFRVPGSEGLIGDILATVNATPPAIERGDVHVLAHLLRHWLKTLPNPLVPMELVPAFIEHCNANKFLAFVERLPQLHLITLTYVIGFLQEMLQAGDINGTEKGDLATIFGPCLVNPSRHARSGPETVQLLTELSVAFCSRLLEVRDAGIIYPLNPAYLVRGPPTGEEAAARPAEPGRSPYGQPAPSQFAQHAAAQSAAPGSAASRVEPPGGSQFAPPEDSQSATAEFARPVAAPAAAHATAAAPQGLSQGPSGDAEAPIDGYYDENGQWQPGMYDDAGQWQCGYYDENGQWQPGYYDRNGEWQSGYYNESGQWIPAGE